MSDNDELIAAFVAEANEALADMEADFLEIERAGANIDSELVNKVFRGIHSMKGTAGYLGLKSIGALAHEMENVLNLIRGQELVPTTAIMEILLRGADALGSMVAHIESSNDFDVSEHVSQLKAAISGDTPVETQKDVEGDIDIELPNGELAFMMVPKIGIVTRQRQGQHIYVIKADLIEHVQARSLTPVDFMKRVSGGGEIIDSYVSTAGVGDLKDDLPESLHFMLLVGSELDKDTLATQLDLPSDSIHHIFSPEGESPPPQPEEPLPPAFMEQPSHQEAETESAPIENKSTEARSTGGSIPKENSLRVNVKILDSLMNLAGELVLGRNQLMQAMQTKDQRGMETVAARIDQVTSELQDAVMQTRMQPIANVFNKFQRVIRDMSRSLGKQIELVIDGKEVELDKKIIEAIGDPLTHLIRNSADHGIEIPDVRVARGKNPVGKIHLKAFHQGGKVNIAISDDGAGIDADKLRKKAVEKGVITAERASSMSDREAIYLIFHAGFSTAEKVTDVSGRGVGMDVVRTNIEKLGGTVDIQTQVGAGTTINVKLPLTLAIIPSMVVRCKDQRYAVPQVNIRELVRIKASETGTKIEKVKDAEVMRLRGSLLPLVRLSDALSCESAGTKDEAVIEGAPNKENLIAGAINILVVESGTLRYGLIVDAIQDSQEIVVKPLGRHMKQAPCLAGATIMGDGHVALILDVSSIAAFVQLQAPEEEALDAEHEKSRVQNDESSSFLLFSNTPNELFAVPMSIISRIERIRSDQIDQVGGKEVLQYRNRSIPLLSVDHYISAQPRPALTRFYVVVFNIHNHEIGLIAPELADMRDLSADVDTVTYRESGVMGSAVVEGQAIRLIDFFELAEKAHPEWFADREKMQPDEEGTKPRVLVVEDSGFFLKQITRFLQDGGFDVVGCEDGQIAWNTLQDPEQKFDLVVTDIEMPNMNGLDLARCIKGDPCFAHLPIIALTSLAGEDDIQRGWEAGIDDYQIKMDREKLLSAVTKHLKSAISKKGLGKKQLRGSAVH